MKSLIKNIKNIFWLMKPTWKYGKVYVIGKFILTIFLNPFQMLIEVTLIQTIIDAIISGATMKSVLWVAVGYEVAYLGVMAIKWSFLLFYERWKTVEIETKINRNIYEKAVITDYEYFDNPEFYNNYTFAVGEFAAKSAGALNFLLTISGTVSIIIAMTAYLAIVGPWIILLAVLGSIAYTFAQTKIGKLGVDRAKESIPHERKMSYVHRVVYQKQYAADLKSSNLKHSILSLFDRSGIGKVGVYKKYAKPFLRWNMFMFLIYHIFELSELAYLIVCAFTRDLSVGAITGAFTAVKKLNNQLTQFASLAGNAVELGLYAEKIREFFDFESVIETKEGGIVPSDGEFSVELKNLSFNYENSDFGLNSITLKINSGEKIAIVGENGAGKSTLIKLLLRLYDINYGDILINNISIKDYDIKNLRKRIGVAFQNPNVYAFSFKENIELYNKTDENKLMEISQALGLNDILNKNNADFSVEVTKEFNKDGIMLSGGEVQKIGLARLLTGNFGLLLLDEPSSALDPLAEYEMNKIILSHSNLSTTIIVAHRLSTIRDADRIILIENGTIKEMGTHNELINLNGKYCEMFTKQAENYIK